MPRAGPHAGATCHGVRFTVTDRDKVEPVRLGLALARALATGWPAELRHERLGDLVGDDRVVEALRTGRPLDEIERLAADGLAPYLRARSHVVRYDATTCLERAKQSGAKLSSAKRTLAPRSDAKTPTSTFVVPGQPRVRQLAGALRIRARGFGTICQKRRRLVPKVRSRVAKAEGVTGIAEPTKEAQGAAPRPSPHVRHGTDARLAAVVTRMARANDLVSSAPRARATSAPAVSGIGMLATSIDEERAPLGTPARSSA